MEWTEYCRSGKKPNHISTMPQKTYKNEFKGFQDFLGYEKVIRKFKEFEDTKKIIKKWKIVSKNQYKELLKQKKKNMTMRIKLQAFHLIQKNLIK